MAPPPRFHEEFLVAFFRFMENQPLRLWRIYASEHHLRMDVRCCGVMTLRLREFTEYSIEVLALKREHIAAILRFPLPMLWSKILCDNEWKNRFGCVLMRLGVLRRFKIRMLMHFRASVQRKGVIIARNRKDAQPDVVIPIVYTDASDPYFATAFSGRFGKTLTPDGSFVVHTQRENTTQRAVEIFWREYRWDHARGRDAVFKHLDEMKTMGRLHETILAMYNLGEKWGYPDFHELTNEYLMRYLEKTIYNDNGNSFHRLSQFVSGDPILATYIWETNFDTEKKRFQLVATLRISMTNQAGFLKAQTLDDLTSYLSKKTMNLKKRKESIYDSVPMDLWRQVEHATADLETAKKGTRVGITGRYISSDNIAAAQEKVRQAYIRCDQWIGRQAKKNK